MKYTKKTNTEIDINSINVYKENVKIPSIRETYAGPNKLSDDGHLYVSVDDKWTDIHEYNLWENDNKTSVDPEVLSSQNASPNYEATHRIVLYKDKNNNNIYFAKPMLIGKQEGNNVYSLDVDKMDNADLNNENGFFYSTSTITEIKDFYFNFNSILSIKIPSAAENIFMKIMDSEKSIQLASIQNYFKLSGLLTDDKLGDDIIDMIKLNFSGTADSPDTIIMEIF